jgi:hypothetical protein
MRDAEKWRSHRKMVAQSYGATATSVAMSAGLPATQGWWPVFVGGHPGWASRRPACPTARRGACGGTAEGWVRQYGRWQATPSDGRLARTAVSQTLVEEGEYDVPAGSPPGRIPQVCRGSASGAFALAAMRQRPLDEVGVAVGSEHGSAEDVPSKTRSSANGAPIGARAVERIPLGTASGLMWCPEGGRSYVRAAPTAHGTPRTAPLVNRPLRETARPDGNG